MTRLWGSAAFVAAMLIGLTGCDDGAAPSGPTEFDAFVRDMAVVPDAVCGNGQLETGEACDDGNTDDGDGCSASCTVEAICGDGEQAGDEACDDGNTDDGDGCSADCQIEPACGDGAVDTGEGCDDGNTDDGDGCSADCQVEAEPDVCGDGAQTGDEACDDGNTDDGDGCDANCEIEADEPVCGNSIVEDGETCDDGNLIDGDGCDAGCQLEAEPACGDGTLDEGEECDDSNTEDGDGCDSDCQREPFCGDGTVDDGEECDDSNADSGDGCDSDCQFEPACGDGTVDDGEACDDGNLNPGDGCDANCQVEPACGDGTVDAGEGCDDGNTDAGDGCDADCQPEPFCGDGTVDDGEGCDDGNVIDGDGCDANCQVEAGCGDGILDPGEECDDGNANGGDGCDAECVVEPVDISAGGDFLAGFQAGGLDRFVFTLAADADVDLSTACPADANLRMTVFRRENGGLAQVAVDADDGCARLVIALGAGDYVVLVDTPDAIEIVYVLTAAFVEIPPPECGNGVLEEGEGCDDDNLINGDGCSDACVSEACGDGVLQPNEDCDEGDLVPGDGCDAACLVETLNISAGGMFVGGFQAGSFDRYAFTLPVESDVRLSTGDGLGGCPGALNLVLIDLANAEIARTEGAGCGAIEQRLPAGEYRVTIAGPAGVAPYQLVAAYVPVPQAECGDRQIQDDEECDDGNLDAGDGCDASCVVEAVDINGGGQFFGSFPARSLDRYSFTLDREADVLITTGDGVGGCPGDTELTLRSADDLIVINDSDLSGGLCAGLAETLPAGDYTVVISGADGSAVGAYFLDASFEFERLPGEACDPEGVLNRCAEPAECRGEPALCRIGDCGDGAEDVGEACDDGNLVNGDGCDAQCRVEACGNDRVDAGEGCDDGNVIDGDGCDANCVSELVCGDGDVDPGEDCDDGNVIDGDGCDADCQREPACGDGFVDAGEGCDDGNVIAGDGCDANCAVEPFCGDGTVDDGEECDDGNQIDGDRCDANCVAEPFCGDGTVDMGEDCDDGNNLGADGCDPLCVREPQCGDGVVDPGEECDDGNLFNGDGCDVVCTLEDPDPDPVCGDGDVDPATEDCDDGNLLNGDGCDALCTFEVIDVNTAFAQFFGAFAAQNGDTFRFTVEATATLFATTDNAEGLCPAGVDTYFTLNRVDVPAEIAVNDDGGDGTCSALNLLLEPGDYELVVTGYEGAAVDGYIFNFQLIADISAGGLFGGGFPAAGDDGFLLTVDANTNVRIATGDGAGGCPGDTELVLYSVDDLGAIALVDTFTDGGDGACAAIDQEFAAGTWLMFVQGTANAAIPAYVLSVERGACGDGVVEGVEACDDGNVLNGDGCDAVCTLEDYDLINAESVAVEAVPVGGIDTYSFIVDDESFLFAATDDPQAGCPGDTLLVLYRVDAGGRVEVARDDDGGDGGCSVLQNNALQAGTYELEVSAVTDLTYRLVVFHTVLINQLGEYAGAIVEGGDDNFSFGLNAPTSLSIRTGDGAGGCPNDTVMQIYSVDANGVRALVVENDDGGDGLCSFVGQEFPAGDYEVVVIGYEDGAVAPYVLSFDLL